MSKLKPVKWVNLVIKLRIFGFIGPYQEGKHPYMIKGNLVLTIPNPHKKDISTDLLSRLLGSTFILFLLLSEKKL